MPNYFNKQAVLDNITYFKTDGLGLKENGDVMSEYLLIDDIEDAFAHETFNSEADLEDFITRDYIPYQTCVKRYSIYDYFIEITQFKNLVNQHT